MTEHQNTKFNSPPNFLVLISNNTNAIDYYYLVATIVCTAHILNSYSVDANEPIITQAKRNVNPCSILL